MISKIFSYVSLIVSIASFLVSGAFFLHRVENDMTLTPVLLLMGATFVMVIICAINYLSTITGGNSDD